MNYLDTPSAVVYTGATQFDTVTDLFILELEERLELSSVVADLVKCLQNIPGSST